MNRSAHLGVLLAGNIAPVAAAQYDIAWHDATCGGATTPVVAGPFSLRSSLGAALAGPPVSAGPYSLGGGFLAPDGVPACYANCDASTIAPVLNVQDFACFLNKFAASDPYANCDGSTITPVLNVQDFACFLNKFAAGCS